MNFYYDPILGLVYKEIAPIVEVNLDAIPVNYSFKEFINLFNKLGVVIFESKPFGSAVTLIPRITTKFMSI